MKKLWVLILSVMFILMFAAASMAATVTVGGELNFGKEFEQNQNFDNNICDAKVTTTATIDDVKAFVAIKADQFKNNDLNFRCDEAWVQFTEDYGVLKIGYFKVKSRQMDIINCSVDNMRTGLTGSYVTKLSDQVTLTLAAAHDSTLKGLQYWAGLGYATKEFGFDVNAIRVKVTDDRYTYLANAYYNIDALRLYLVCGDNQINSPALKNLVIGFNYDSANVPFAVRAEYNLEKINNENEYGIRLDYKINKNYKLEYQYKHAYNKDYKSGPYTAAGTYDQQYLKMNVVF